MRSVWKEEKKTKQTSDVLTYDTGSLLTTDVARDGVGAFRCVPAHDCFKTAERMLLHALHVLTSTFKRNLATYNTTGFTQQQMNPGTYSKQMSLYSLGT